MSRTTLMPDVPLPGTSPQLSTGEVSDIPLQRDSGRWFDFSVALALLVVTSPLLLVAAVLVLVPSAATRIGAPNAVGGGFPDNAFACEQNSFVVKGEVHDAWTAGPAAAIGLSHCTWYYVGANCGGAPGVNIAPFSAHAIATACIMANV